VCLSVAKYFGGFLYVMFVLKFVPLAFAVLAPRFTTILVFEDMIFVSRFSFSHSWDVCVSVFTFREKHSADVLTFALAFKIRSGEYQ
jgi:hypothetical protein